MKSLIGIVVALLCVQTIHALLGIGNSRKGNRRDRDVDLEKFFDEFQYEHDIAHDDYVSIKTICDALTDGLAGLAAESFGTEQSSADTECQITSFLSSFFAMRLVALEKITHLRYYCDVLLNMAAQFRCERKLVCNKDAADSGCQKNKLNCDLLEFFSILAQAGAVAKQLLDGILSDCDVLGIQARDFDCTYGPRCQDTKCSCGERASNVDLLAEFKTFIQGFKAVHDETHIKFAQVGVICDQLSAAITQWVARV